MTSRPAQFVQEVRALGAVEFALIVPVMLLVWVGTVELAELHLASRKVTVAAQTAADLIAQEKSVTEAQLEDVIAAVNAIMVPYPTTSMSYDLVSVEADTDGSVSIGWRFTQGTASAGIGGIPPKAPPLLTENDSVIVAVISYQHQPLFDIGIVTEIVDVNITEEAYSRPRKVSKIPLIE